MRDTIKKFLTKRVQKKRDENILNLSWNIPSNENSKRLSLLLFQVIEGDTLSKKGLYAGYLMRGKWEKTTWTELLWGHQNRVWRVLNSNAQPKSGTSQPLTYPITFFPCSDVFYSGSKSPKLNQAVLQPPFTVQPVNLTAASGFLNRKMRKTHLIQYFLC